MPERDSLVYPQLTKKEPQPQQQPQETKRTVQPLPEEEPGVLSFLGRRLKFVFHDEAQIFQIQVLDMDADKTIRKIPSDEILHFIGVMRKLLGETVDQYV